MYRPRPRHGAASPTHRGGIAISLPSLTSRSTTARSSPLGPVERADLANGISDKLAQGLRVDLGEAVVEFGIGIAFRREAASIGLPEGSDQCVAALALISPFLSRCLLSRPGSFISRAVERPVMGVSGPTDLPARPMASSRSFGDLAHRRDARPLCAGPSRGCRRHGAALCRGGYSPDQASE
jgi:hypothetical protein